MKETLSPQSLLSFHDAAVKEARTALAAWLQLPEAVRVGEDSDEHPLYLALRLACRELDRTNRYILAVSSGSPTAATSVAPSITQETFLRLSHQD